MSIFFLYAMVRSLEFSFSKVELSNGVILHPLENGIFENFVKVFTTDVNFPTILANFGVGLVLNLSILTAYCLVLAAGATWSSGEELIMHLREEPAK